MSADIIIIPSWSWYEAQVRGRDEEHHGGDGPGRHLRLRGQRDPCKAEQGENCLMK